MWGSNELAFTDSKGVGGPPLSKDLGEERAEPELWSKTGGCGGGGGWAEAWDEGEATGRPFGSKRGPLGGKVMMRLGQDHSPQPESWAAPFTSWAP